MLKLNINAQGKLQSNAFNIQKLNRGLRVERGSWKRYVEIVSMKSRFMIFLIAGKLSMKSREFLSSYKNNYLLKKI